LSSEADASALSRRGRLAFEEVFEMGHAGFAEGGGEEHEEASCAGGRASTLSLRFLSTLTSNVEP
ncbi:MAG: hypothetical protein SGPRY_010913, partial [Prymnesium sp.]